MSSIPKNFVILTYSLSMIQAYLYMWRRGDAPPPPPPCLGFNCKTTLKLCGPYWKWRKLLSRAREPMRTGQRMQKEGRALPRLRASVPRLRAPGTQVMRVRYPSCARIKCALKENRKDRRKGLSSGKVPKLYISFGLLVWVAAADLMVRGGLRAMN